jgi:hypothetical protein
VSDDRPLMILGYGATTEQHEQRQQTLSRRSFHRDLSTAIVIPTRGQIPARVYESHMSMIFPPNQKRTLLVVAGMEVGAAYDFAIRCMLDHPDLAKWRYILTVEEDNLIPPTAVADLLGAADDGDWDVLGGLYWTKGEMGVPQLWGDPDSAEENYRPQLPDEHGGIVRVNATGMGFTVFRLDIFRRLPEPWFVTQAGPDGMWTQDLWFFHQARQAGLGLKVGVHSGVKIGHLDVGTGIVW